ncbi:5-hydroxytryptamine receptor 4-like [Hydractinia symbiolongicarpus]|uniref:5-hydroxytryptamine receptor 4-like n=1 Tax=Hydractinia symbiolongicarpus TaxID=13093 RepID=UPI00255081A3|nr:5-hydroxytryptamine receptor 4-like [Hydractinia symbiolongicarpus]
MTDANSTCQFRMSLLHEPLVTVFGVLFSFIAVATVLGNILVLAVLRLGINGKKSNHILTSLAISDLLVGLILAPLTSWQLITRNLHNCEVEAVRVYFTAFLICTSLLTVALIALDRYILLTKLGHYRRCMTSKRTSILILFAWLIPGIAPLLRFVGKYTYLSILILICFGSFLLLILSYYYLTKAVREKEKTLNSHRRDSRICFHLDSRRSKKQRAREKAHIKLAKIVIIIVMCHFFCLISTNIWIAFDLLKVAYSFISPLTHQCLYLAALVTSQINSCLNPVIYFLKNPEFRRGFRFLIKQELAYSSTKEHYDVSSTSMTVFNITMKENSKC